MWAGMVWIGTRGPLTAEGQVTTQSPSLSSLKASAERRNDSLKLEALPDQEVSCSLLSPEAQLSLIVNRGFRGSILPYNPEKNEVSIKRFSNVKPSRQC